MESLTCPTSFIYHTTPVVLPRPPAPACPLSECRVEDVSLEFLLVLHLISREVR